MPNRTDRRLPFLRTPVNAALAETWLEQPERLATAPTLLRRAVVPRSGGDLKPPRGSLSRSPHQRNPARRSRAGLTERLSVGALARPRPEQRVTYASVSIVASSLRAVMSGRSDRRAFSQRFAIIMRPKPRRPTC